MQPFRRVVLLLVGCAVVQMFAIPSALAQCYPGTTPPPCCALVGTTFATNAAFGWSPSAVGCPALYDVARGDLQTLFVTKALAGPLTICLPGEDAAAGVAAADGVMPPANQGFWYLPRTENLTYNEPSPAQVVDRDIAIFGICPI